MINLRFMRLTHAAGTIYNAGEVAAFADAVGRTIIAAGHAVEHRLGLGETQAVEPEPPAAPVEPAGGEPVDETAAAGEAEPPEAHAAPVEPASASA